VSYAHIYNINLSIAACVFILLMMRAEKEKHIASVLLDWALCIIEH